MSAFSIGSERWPGVAKVLEECGELTQVLGKLVQIGGAQEHWDGDLWPLIEDELADVQASIAYLIDANAVLDKQTIARRKALKESKFWAWHDEATA